MSAMSETLENMLFSGAWVGCPKTHLFAWAWFGVFFQTKAHNADGRHIAYLNAPEFQALDDVLMTVLRTIIERVSGAFS